MWKVYHCTRPEPGPMVDLTIFEHCLVTRNVLHIISESRNSLRFNLKGTL